MKTTPRARTSAAGDGSRAGVLPVSRIRPAYQQMAEQLRDLVIGGGLAPGDRLPAEGELAGMFGVSRSTAREALGLLATRGLITMGPGGSFVNQMEPSQVSDYLETSLGLMSGPDGISMAAMLEAREILEIPAARLAAGRRDEHHLALLRAALERGAHSHGREAKFKEHQHFHKLIVAAAGNDLLNVMTEPVFKVLETRFVRPDIPGSFWPEVDGEHVEILRHIERGEGDLAADAMRRHLGALRGVYHDTD
ncbi:FadR/GntR family transcriptional regulator [Nonomuraea sp. NPDC048916]|uniref:FadR/GntR family transcriptional regulator n=1 Tax=Nonomuraea sp. NPDC048916 TaxID=3154232 RepID=UPI0033DDDED5